MSGNNGRERFLYIDNLRLLMIILVIMVHLGVTYSGIGSWYIMEQTQLGVAATLFFGLFQSFTQAYFMGFLFLISGYFVVKSYDKKGFGKFVLDRFIRLGIPTLIYMLIIQPFIEYVILGDTWQRPVFMEYYIRYITDLHFISGSGPLWFAFALFIFNLIYAIIRRIVKSGKVAREKKLPTTKSVMLLILLISVCAFSIRLVQPIDTSIINMQLCFFSQYVILFVVGISAGRYQWFSQLSYKNGIRWLMAALIPGIICWSIMMISGGALDGGFDLYKGGFYWQSVAYAVWESFTAVAMSIGLIALGKEKWNQQSKLVKMLSDNSFAVYMFHPPIIIIVTKLLLNLHSDVLVKYFIACILGISLSFLITNFILKHIPLLKKVL